MTAPRREGDPASWALEGDGIRFSYRGSGVPALGGISLRLPRGGFLGVVGGGGAGKSTLLRCLNRIIPEFYRGTFQGEVRVVGEATRGRRVREMARRVGMVFQDFEAQLFSTTVELEVAFGAEHLGAAEEKLRGLVSRYLTLTGLEGYRDRDPAALSGGEKQKLAIASVLAMESPILVLDEPTTDLDPVGRRQVWDLVHGLRRQGSTVVAADHDTEALVGCDEILVLSRGEPAIRGSPPEVLGRVAELERFGVGAPELARVATALTGEPALPSGPEDCRDLLDRRDIRPVEEYHQEYLRRERSRTPECGPEILRLENVGYRYPDGRGALRGIDLQVREGEFITLLGANGSGKTTLAKHLNGLLEPTEGRVLWKGEDLRRYRISEMGRRVGFVFQNPDHQIFSSTVREEVGFAPRNLGFPEPEVASRVEEALRTVGLEGKEGSDPFLLTKGERQRLAVASVLAARPAVLILDEPTTGLDPPSQNRMMDLLDRLNRGGHTLIIITHALSLASRYARRTVLMAGGEVVADGSTRSLFGSPALLESASLQPPPVVSLGRLYGRTILSSEEFLFSCGFPPGDPGASS